MTLWPWRRSRQNHPQKSRFENFLALAPEVDKISTRNHDVMAFWPWLRKPTKSVPGISISYLVMLLTKMLVILLGISLVTLLIKMSAILLAILLIILLIKLLAILLAISLFVPLAKMLAILIVISSVIVLAKMLTSYIVN